MSNTYYPTPTPCVGTCSTVFGDVVCRGCRRYVHEVIDWNRYDESQKRLVLSRLDHLTQQVIESHFQVLNENTCRQWLQGMRPTRRPEAPLLCLVWEYIRQSDVLPSSWENAGLKLHNPATYDKSAPYLKALLKEELHILACAHYELAFGKTLAPRP